MSYSRLPGCANRLTRLHNVNLATCLRTPKLFDFRRLNEAHQSVIWIGGANRDRTDDLKLAKLALSQLSYGPVVLLRSWWAWEDLNFRPHAYQARALTN